MANQLGSKSGLGGAAATSLFESLEARRMLAFSVGRAIIPGIQYRPATDAKPSRGRADGNRRHAHTQFVQLLPKGLTTPSAAGSTVPVGLTASQVRQAYGVNTLTFGGITGDGAGQTIAIIDAFDHPGFVDSTDPNFLNSDLHKFDVAMGLSDPPSFRKIDENGGTSYPAANAGWASEIALDVEWAHAMAPKANIVLIVADSANTYDLIEVAANTARNLPGVTAVSMSFAVDGGFAGEDYYDQFFTTPVGHAGVTFLASTGDHGAVLPSGGTTKQAGYPSESPNVVAVGGTSLQLSSGAYASESGWSGSGGGISNYLAKPTYQSGISFSATQRMTPDVSMVADPNTGVAVYDSYNNTNGWFAGYFGGTSLSSPLWAGLVALTNQGRALNGLSSLNGVSQTLPRLYQLPSSTIHDVTTGNNGYAVGAGYDLVTGRGTPIADQLLPALAGGTYTGRVFQDNNGDNAYNGTDSPMSGRTVFDDLNSNGTLDSGEPSSVTTVTGLYTIADLVGGQAYNIRLSTPAGYIGVGPTSVTGTTAYGTTAIDFGFFPTIFNASGATNFTLRLDATGQKAQIFQNTPTTGTPDYQIAENVLGNITINGSAADDLLTVDLANGNFAAAHVITFTAGGQSTADQIAIKAAGSLTASFAAGVVTAGLITINHTGVEATSYSGGAGADSVTIFGNAAPTFTGGGGADSITLNGANFAPTNDLGADGSSVYLAVGNSSTATFSTPQHLRRLGVGNTSGVVLAGSGNLLHTGLLSINTASPGGYIDLGANSLIVDAPSTLSYVPALVVSGYAAGLWNGPGIRSSVAAADASKKTGVGFGSGAGVLNLAPGGSGTYLGETLTYNAVVARYTLYGDADLSGTVDFNDFLRLQNSFGLVATTWTRGDFNFDGNSDFTDFLSLQNAFGLFA